MKTRAFRVAGAVALLVLGTAFPACAQFVGNYPVIIVPPPQAQNYVLPKPAPKAPSPEKSLSAEAPSGPDVSQCYAGKTKVCP
jgi:hypothetical protein